MRDLYVSFGQLSPSQINGTRMVSWEKFSGWLTAVPPEVTDKAGKGWYIPVEFNPVYRDSENFVARHAITFDFDKVTLGTWERVLDVWGGLEFAIYTTYSHAPEAPRFRVVMPLARPAGYDEFQAVARKVAADVGIELIARESFVPAQMMYSPTRRLGGAFESLINHGDWLDVDAVLAEYKDWTDVQSWPRRADADHPGVQDAARVDPRAKPGLIGEFNRTFSIAAAIARFELPYRRVA